MIISVMMTPPFCRLMTRAIAPRMDENADLEGFVMVGELVHELGA